MKKILVTALAAMSLVACLQEEVVTVPQTDPITFDGAYVNIATRAAADPSTTTATIAGFDVWAFMNESDGTVLVDEDVKKAGNLWTYANTQYWTPENDYYFAALAPMNSANVTETIASGAAAKLGLGEVKFTNVDGSEDLLYAKAHVLTPVYAELKQGNMPPVRFQFQHLLSKVKFTFTNGFLTDNAYVEVLDIKMTAPKSGTINLAQADYTTAWVLDGTETYSYGDVEKLSMGQKAECEDERLTIPAGVGQSYEVSFTVKLYMGEQLALETTKTSTVSGVAFEMGKAYNLTAEITPDNLELPAIEFDVIVEDWVNPTTDVPAYTGKTVYVETPADFTAAVSNPEVGAIVLNNDIELGSNTLTRSGAAEEAVITKSFVLDGNGNTLTYTGSSRVIDIKSDVENETFKNVTIKNLTINCTNSNVERGINYNANGRLHLEGVKMTGTAPTYAVNFPGKADNAYVTIDNCELTGKIALNVWGENMFIDVQNSVLSNYDKTEAENYAAVKLNNDGNTVANGTVVNVKNSRVVATDEKGDPVYAFYNASETGEFIIDEATEVVGENVVQVAIVYYASNPNQFYGCTTLAGAIDTYNETDATGIRLTRDIKLDAPVKIAKDQNVVIDLNGKTISAVDETTKNYELINNAGTLRIFGGGKMTVKSTVNSGWNRYSAVIANTVGGNLTVEDVVIEHLGGTDMAYGIDNLTNGKGTYAVTTIDGATVKSPYRAVRQFLNGTEATNELHVKAGSVLEGANKSIFFHDPSNKANSGKLVVEDGAQLNGDVYLYVTAGSTEWPVEVSIAESALVGESTVVSGNVPAGYLVMNKDGQWVVVNAAEEGIVVVYTAEELNNLKATDAYVVLGADIDFQGATMTKPIEIWKNSTFDGLGHKISNVQTAVQGGYATSLFRGDANQGNKVVKNLVIENLTTPAGYSYASAIWSDLQGANIEIDNVTINNATIEANGTIGGFVGFVSGSTTSVVIKNSTISNSNLNGGEADHKRGAVVGRAYGCTVTCENVVVDNVKINGEAATASTLVGDKGYTGTVTVK